MKPKFFKTPADFRNWLEAHHSDETELWVGFYKKDSGKPSITWPESVDEALCFGWIDGVRKRLDDKSYVIRFTPRRSRSIWSEVNIKRATELTRQRKMRAAGKKAFEARLANKSGVYSYEKRKAELDEPYASTFQINAAAWKYYQAQPPSYRRLVDWWILSAKREETRQSRLAKLIEHSSKNEWIPQLVRTKPQ